MVKIGSFSQAKLLKIIGGGGRILSGEASSVEVTELAEPQEATDHSVSFIINETFLAQAATTNAAVLVVQNAFAEKVLPNLSKSVQVCLACDDAYLALANLTKEVVDQNPFWDWRLHDGDEAARIHPTAKIGPRTLILPNVVVGPDVEIGADCILYPGVVVYPRTVIGNRVRVHANTVLGSDGFGYARTKTGAVKIWHLGRVVIHDDVEIGAGTMIDRGTIKDTIIEQGVKIDNLVQIGHNGHIKMHAVLCGQAGLAGGVTVGRGAILAGKAAIADKIHIGDGAIVGPLSGISKDVPAGEMHIGVIPARPKREFWRLIATLDRLPDFLERVKKLEGKLK